MARFDKKVARMLAYDTVLEIDKGLEYLSDVADALKSAVEHYEDQEKLNNWNEHWYRNAKNSYENKLEEVDGIIVQLEAKRASLSTHAVTPKV